MPKCRNFQASIVPFTAAAANTEYAVAHELTDTPRGFIVVRRAQAHRVYLGTTAWDTTYAYLKGDGPVGQFLILFFL